jgi:hypothetical protein
MPDLFHTPAERDTGILDAAIDGEQLAQFVCSTVGPDARHRRVNEGKIQAFLVMRRNYDREHAANARRPSMGQCSRRLSCVYLADAAKREHLSFYNK